MRVTSADVGCIVRELREAQRVSQGDLARLLGHHQATMSRLESGAIRWSIEDLCAVGEILNCSPMMIMGLAVDRRLNALLDGAA